MKDRIFYHRSYRTIPDGRAGAALDLLALIVPLELLLLIFHEQLLNGVISAARWVLDRCGIETIVAYDRFLPFLIKSVPVLDTPAVFPSSQFAMVNLIVALLIVLFLPLVRFIPRPLTVYVVFVSLLNVCSAVFFLLVPERFPYDIFAFSSLYMKLALGLWLLLPILLAVVLNPLPGRTIGKFTVTSLTLVYSILFATVRYAVFVYLMTRFSVLYMAAMFFTLGPFADFVYVVSIYSIYLNLLALKLKKQPEAWQWLS